MSHPVPGPPVPPKPFKLECVIVCDGYSDFLQQTLPHNKHLFDKVVVVTAYEDRATRKVCEYNHVTCIPTDATESRKKKFCKGAAINVGLAALDKDAWVLHMDADMYLPPQTRILISEMDLDKSMVYGIDRFIVDGWEKWQEFIEAPKLQHEDETWIHVNTFPIGTRVMHRHVGGYVNIGFFQLWYPSVANVFVYPEGHTNASREDTAFLAPWPRAKRGFCQRLLATIYNHQTLNMAPIG